MNVKGTARAARHWTEWLRVGLFVLMAVSAIAILRVLPIGDFLSIVAAQVDRLGYWGPLLFGVVYVAAAVLFVPGSALTMTAGAVFGLALGTVTVSLAATSAAAAAFLISRYLFRPSVRAWADGHPRFQAIDAAIGEGGWKIIALLRLSPLLPFSMGNYLFGVTAIRFWPYVLASWVFMLPGTFLYVYLGYAGRAGLSAATGAAPAWSAGRWALLVVGLAATALATVYISRLAMRAIQRQTAGDGGAPSHASHTPDAVPALGGSAGRPPFGLMLVTALLAFAAAWTYNNQARVKALFGPPPVVMTEAFADRTEGLRFDHGRFDALLRRHVDHDGFVDYQALVRDASDLDAYLETLAAAPLDALSRNERLALLINAYNAYTLRLILDHYPLQSIRDIAADERWDGRTWSVGEHLWTLNQIEHQEIRPKFAEPRIHWALVCAAIGCPPLRREAYTGDRLDDQLEDQAALIHQNGRWFRYDRANLVVYLTTLYNWYRGDFEQAAGSILVYAAGYSQALRRDLDAGAAPQTVFLEYDWTLNDQAWHPERTDAGGRSHDVRGGSEEGRPAPGFTP